MLGEGPVTKHIFKSMCSERKTKYINVKDYSCNPSTCICENSKHLKSITDTSVIKCDEIISVLDIVSTKMTNTMQQMYQ